MFTLFLTVSHDRYDIYTNQYDLEADFLVFKLMNHIKHG